MENGDQLFLRDAGPEDMRFLLDLRNEPESRRWSFHHEIISEEEHKAWFDRALSDKDVRIYILSDKEKSAGNVRINFVSEGTWRISYAVCPENRGKHYGRKMLTLLEKEVCGSVRTLLAEVDAENIASVRTFETLHYIREKEADGVIVFRKDLF